MAVVRWLDGGRNGHQPPVTTNKDESAKRLIVYFQDAWNSLSAAQSLSISSGRRLNSQQLMTDVMHIDNEYLQWSACLLHASCNFAVSVAAA